MATRRSRKTIPAEAERVLAPRPEVVEKAVPAVEDSAHIEAAQETLQRIKERKTKTVRALRNERGVYGRIKFDLVAGKHYTFPVEVAEHLARTGRVI